LLDDMPPYQAGGDMIKSVSFDKTIYNDLPYKFEAGTPNVAGVVGLGAAVSYLESLDAHAIARHECDLLDYGTQALARVPGLRLIGTAPEKTSVLSFVLSDVHPHDVGTILDSQGIAVRTGHHCAQPAMEHFNVPATVRASLAFHNTREEIDLLVKSLEKVREVFDRC
jgi:cysteine desulfurase/selenocysteine lyase